MSDEREDVKYDARTPLKNSELISFANEVPGRILNQVPNWNTLSSIRNSLCEYELFRPW